MRNTTAASTAESCIQAIDAKRRKTRQVAAVLLALGALVAVGVFWWLHSTGIALTNEVYCGLEEHQHSDACYETVLTCGLEEDGSSDGHVHTDDCYETVLTCGLEEHTHTAACLSNNEADVETQADWEATLPELTGNLADDVVAVAESQLGYEESTENYTLADDGTTHQGYTRYGAWYAEGMEYADWDAMFASFCLYYAGVDESAFPLNSGAYAWATELAELGYYAEAADATPAVGDLVFFDENADTRPDRVGIVAAMESTSGNEANGSGTVASAVRLTVIEGDYAENENDVDVVTETTYLSNDSTILGYASLPGTEVSQNGAVAVALNAEPSYPLEEHADVEVDWNDNNKTLAITIAENIATKGKLDPNTTYYYQIEIAESVSLDSFGGTVADAGGTVLGTWTISSAGLLTMTFNDVIDGYSDFQGWIKISYQVDSEPSVEKTCLGYNVDKKTIDWQVEVVIPAYSGSGKANCWKMSDLSLLAYQYIDLSNATIVLKSSQYPNGIELQNLDSQNFNENATYAYYISGNFLYLANKCNCTSESCNYWSGNACGRAIANHNGWCTCWTSSYNSTLVITYSEDVSAQLQELINKESSKGDYSNNFLLYEDDSVIPITGTASGTVPLLLGKSKTSSFDISNDYTAQFTVTVNQSGEDYTDWDSLDITDTLTKLSYVLGSMKITDSSKKELEMVDGDPGEPSVQSERGRYFSVAYDADTKVISIKIWYPTNETYTIAYDVMLDLPEDSTTTVNYSNKVEFDGLYKIYSDSYESSSGWQVTSLMATIQKYETGTTESLKGAEFGLYTSEGNLIATGVTDDSGQITFQTNRTAGILISRNTAYYIQEITAPTGYNLDQTEHWFYFTDNKTAIKLPDRVDVKDVISKEIDSGSTTITITAYNSPGHELPNTGGTGTWAYGIAGLTLCSVAGFIAYRRRNRTS